MQSVDMSSMFTRKKTQAACSSDGVFNIEYTPVEIRKLCKFTHQLILVSSEQGDQCLYVAICLSCGSNKVYGRELTGVLDKVESHFQACRSPENQKVFEVRNGLSQVEEGERPVTKHKAPKDAAKHCARCNQTFPKVFQLYFHLLRDHYQPDKGVIQVLHKVETCDIRKYIDDTSSYIDGNTREWRTRVRTGLWPTPPEVDSPNVTNEPPLDSDDDDRVHAGQAVTTTLSQSVTASRPKQPESSRQPSAPQKDLTDKEGQGSAATQQLAVPDKGQAIVAGVRDENANASGQAGVATGVTQAGEGMAAMLALQGPANDQQGDKSSDSADVAGMGRFPIQYINQPGDLDAPDPAVSAHEPMAESTPFQPRTSTVAEQQASSTAEPDDDDGLAQWEYDSNGVRKVDDHMATIHEYPWICPICTRISFKELDKMLIHAAAYCLLSPVLIAEANRRQQLGYTVDAKALAMQFRDEFGIPTPAIEIHAAGNLTLDVWLATAHAAEVSSAIQETVDWVTKLEMASTVRLFREMRSDEMPAPKDLGAILLWRYQARPSNKGLSKVTCYRCKAAVEPVDLQSHHILCPYSKCIDCHQYYKMKVPYSTQAHTCPGSMLVCYMCAELVMRANWYRHLGSTCTFMTGNVPGASHKKLCIKCTCYTPWDMEHICPWEPVSGQLSDVRRAVEKKREAVLGRKDAVTGTSSASGPNTITHSVTQGRPDQRPAARMGGSAPSVPMPTGPTTIVTSQPAGGKSVASTHGSMGRTTATTAIEGPIMQVGIPDTAAGQGDAAAGKSKGTTIPMQVSDLVSHSPAGKRVTKKVPNLTYTIAKTPTVPTSRVRQVAANPPRSGADQAPEIKCDACRQPIANIHAYQTHALVCPARSSHTFPCHLCDAHLADAMELNGHLLSHLQLGGSIGCPYCTRQFNEMGRYEAHMNMHVRADATGTKGSEAMSFTRADNLDTVTAASSSETEYEHVNGRAVSRLRQDTRPDRIRPSRTNVNINTRDDEQTDRVTRKDLDELRAELRRQTESAVTRVKRIQTRNKGTNFVPDDQHPEMGEAERATRRGEQFQRGEVHGDRYTRKGDTDRRDPGGRQGESRKEDSRRDDETSHQNADGNHFPPRGGVGGGHGPPSDGGGDDSEDDRPPRRGGRSGGFRGGRGSRRGHLSDTSDGESTFIQVAERGRIYTVLDTTKLHPSLHKLIKRASAYELTPTTFEQIYGIEITHATNMIRHVLSLVRTLERELITPLPVFRGHKTTDIKAAVSNAISKLELEPQDSESQLSHKCETTLDAVYEATATHQYTESTCVRLLLKKVDVDIKQNCERQAELFREIFGMEPPLIFYATYLEELYMKDYDPKAHDDRLRAIRWNPQRETFASVVNKIEKGSKAYARGFDFGNKAAERLWIDRYASDILKNAIPAEMQHDAATAVAAEFDPTGAPKPFRDYCAIIHRVWRDKYAGSTMLVKGNPQTTRRKFDKLKDQKQRTRTAQGEDVTEVELDPSEGFANYVKQNPRQGQPQQRDSGGAGGPQGKRINIIQVRQKLGLKPTQCLKCGNDGHRFAECRTYPGRITSTPCQHCKNLLHRSQACRRRQAGRTHLAHEDEEIECSSQDEEEDEVESEPLEGEAKMAWHPSVPKEWQC